MSAAAQQQNYTTGLNVTGTILNTEFGNIITHLNFIYTLIDNTGGAGVLTIDTTNDYLGVNYATPETGLDVVQGKTVESITNVIARFRASTSAAADAGVLIGSLNGNAPFITDAPGGGTSVGMTYKSEGDLFLDAGTASNIKVKDSILANTDNLYDVGGSSNRFDDIYATNGTIQTSDQNDKEAIEDSALGLDFISTLRPVTYKWKKSYKKNQGEQVDEDGEIVQLEEKKTQEKRKHYGLLAQEVETALDGTDFAGLVVDQESGKYGLRYNEFIPILIKAIQELKAEVDTLK